MIALNLYEALVAALNVKLRTPFGLTTGGPGCIFVRAEGTVENVLRDTLTDEEKSVRTAQRHFEQNFVAKSARPSRDKTCDPRDPAVRQMLKKKHLPGDYEYGGIVLGIPPTPQAM